VRERVVCVCVCVCECICVCLCACVCMQLLHMQKYFQLQIHRSPFADDFCSSLPMSLISHVFFFSRSLSLSHTHAPTHSRTVPTPYSLSPLCTHVYVYILGLGLEQAQRRIGQLRGKWESRLAHLVDQQQEASQVLIICVYNICTSSREYECVCVCERVRVCRSESRTQPGHLSAPLSIKTHKYLCIHVIVMHTCTCVQVSASCIHILHS